MTVINCHISVTYHMTLLQVMVILLYIIQKNREGSRTIMLSYISTVRIKNSGLILSSYSFLLKVFSVFYLDFPIYFLFFSFSLIFRENRVM